MTIVDLYAKQVPVHVCQHVDRVVKDDQAIAQDIQVKLVRSVNVFCLLSMVLYRYTCSEKYVRQADVGLSKNEILNGYRDVPESKGQNEQSILFPRSH